MNCCWIWFAGKAVSTPHSREHVGEIVMLQKCMDAFGGVIADHSTNHTGVFQRSQHGVRSRQHGYGMSIGMQ